MLYSYFGLRKCSLRSKDFSCITRLITKWLYCFVLYFSNYVFSILIRISQLFFILEYFFMIATVPRQYCMMYYIQMIRYSILAETRTVYITQSRKKIFYFFSRNGDGAASINRTRRCTQVYVYDGKKTYLIISSILCLFVFS